MSKASTLKDVAVAAKCHPSTVSLALRGDLRIPKETRERIRAIADSLGYRANPLVSAWVAARRAGREPGATVAAAYLTAEPGNFSWPADHHLQSIFESAKERAAQHGLTVTEFRYKNSARSLERLNQILVTRDIRAVIIGPALMHHELTGLDWDRYSLVTIGYALTNPPLNRVAADHHAGMKRAFEKCIAGGHRRIGLAFVLQHNAARIERWIGAYLFEQFQNCPANCRLPVFAASSASPVEESQAWMKKAKPDIVLTDAPDVWRGAGVPVLGFTLSGPDGLTGVETDNRGIGSRAADLLSSMVVNNERGIPSIRQTVLVEPPFGGGDRPA